MIDILLLDFVHMLQLLLDFDFTQGFHPFILQCVYIHLIPCSYCFLNYILRDQGLRMRRGCIVQKELVLLQTELIAAIVLKVYFFIKLNVWLIVLKILKVQKILALLNVEWYLLLFILINLRELIGLDCVILGIKIFEIFSDFRSIMRSHCSLRYLHALRGIIEILV